MEQKQSTALWIGTALAITVLAAGGIGFYRQLSRQSVNKANSVRARLLWVEGLPEGRLAICNRDDKTPLVRLQLKTKAGAWHPVPMETPVAPSKCVEINLPSAPPLTDISHFSALWQGELEVRYQEELPLGN